jgi:hypothetical protein
MTDQILTEDALRMLLRKQVKGNALDWALCHGVSNGFVNDFLSGRSSPGPKILRAMNAERVYRVKG